MRCLEIVMCNVVSIVFWLLVSHVAYRTRCLCYCIPKSNQATYASYRLAIFPCLCKQPDTMFMLNARPEHCCKCTATGASPQISLAAAVSCLKYAHNPEAEFAVTAFHCILLSGLC